MKKIFLTISAILMVTFLITACTRQQVGTVGGAVAGGVVGSSVTGGSTAGTIAGAVGGGYVGHQLTR